jgi:hypothetical protein
VGDVLTSWSFDPNPVPAATAYSTLSFTMRPDVVPGAQHDFQIFAGSPLVETAPEVCELPITFDVIGS